MPVFHEGIPKFTIQPPLTTGDTGQPTSSLLLDTERIFALIEDERHLTARKLYQSVLARLSSLTLSKNTNGKQLDQVQLSSSLTYKRISRWVPSRNHQQQQSVTANKQDAEVDQIQRILQDRVEILDKLEVN
jgi:hypothetical protein